MSNLRVVEVCNCCRSIFVSETSVRDLFRALDGCRRFRISVGNLSVSFVSKPKMREIHGRFLDDPSLTDVITFRGDPDFDFAGEVVVCPACALDQSRAWGTTFPNEVKLYLVHGYLHLCGLGDESEEEAREMRSAETFCLDFLKNFDLEVDLKPRIRSTHTPL
ncbi:MAG: rRNA maturation RNase YbeY [Puniceicoccales bacterium]|nr:rRNA maturation RNase YbeY [Puniceicoccales bacterium]